nr:hypothetical protein [Tanacetum cinerariifolium]
MQTQTSNALHNAIMEAGGKDHPPMLAPGNYVQWKSRIKRYIDTKPNNERIHYCLQNPQYKFKWTEKIVSVAKGNSETTTEGYMKNYKNVSQDIRDQLNDEAKAVQIILTTIDNDIYSTVDACLNEIRAERLARTANPLALVAQQQQIYHPQHNPNHYTQNSLTRPQQTTRNRGKAIVNSSAPIYDQEPAMVTEDDEMSKEKKINKLMALISPSFKKIYKPTNNNLRTLSNSSRVTTDTVDNSGPIFDVEPLQKDGTNELAQERDLLASLIEKLKYEIEDNKNHNKVLDTSNKALVDKLKGKIEDFKTKNKSLESSNNHFKKANNELSKTNQLMFKDLKKFQAELDRQMCGSEYGEQDKKAAILYEYGTFKAIEGNRFLDTYLRYLQVINGLKKCGYKKDN